MDESTYKYALIFIYIRNFLDKRKILYDKIFFAIKYRVSMNFTFTQDPLLYKKKMNERLVI